MMLISCTKLFMNARIARKIGRSIHFFFGSSACWLSIFSSTAKSTAKYFIIDAELQGHLNNLAHLYSESWRTPRGVKNIYN